MTQWITKCYQEREQDMRGPAPPTRRPYHGEALADGIASKRGAQSTILNRGTRRVPERDAAPVPAAACGLAFHAGDDAIDDGGAAMKSSAKSCRTDAEDHVVAQAGDGVADVNVRIRRTRFGGARACPRQAPHAPDSASASHSSTPAWRHQSRREQGCCPPSSHVLLAQPLPSPT